VALADASELAAAPDLWVACSFVPGLRPIPRDLDDGDEVMAFDAVFAKIREH
jgi:hypothetical protein